MQVALRTPNRRFVSIYALLWAAILAGPLGMPLMVVRGGTLSPDDPVVALVAPWLAAIVFAVLSVGAWLLYRRPRAVHALVVDDAVVLPRSWLRPTTRRIAIEEITTCTTFGFGPFRRLLVDTGALFAAQCPAWWFESPTAIDELHRSIESRLLANERDPNARRRIRTMSALGARSAVAGPIAIVGVVWVVAFYVVEMAFGSPLDVVYLGAVGAHSRWWIAAGEYWRLVSAAALHLGLAHLVGNVVGIFLISPQAFAMAGWSGLLVIFIAGAVVGGLASTSSVSAVGIGASPGVYGWLGAWMVWGVTQRRRVASPFVASPGLVVLLVLLEGGAKLAFPNIDTATHLGGIVGGAAAAWAISGTSRRLAIDGPPPIWVRTAGTLAAVTLVVVPVWGYVHGLPFDARATSERAIDLMDARDVARGASAPFGLVLCLSTEMTRDRLTPAYEKVRRVRPAEPLREAMWQTMVGCMRYRLGDAESSWALTRDAVWSDPTGLSTSVLGAMAADLVARGGAPVALDPNDAPVLSHRAEGLDIRFDAPAGVRRDVDVFVPGIDASVLLYVGFGPGVESRTIAGDGRHCELTTHDLSHAVLMGVAPWPKAVGHGSPTIRCHFGPAGAGTFGVLPE